MHKLLVSIIIVNWNGKHFLNDCLGSLSKISYKNTETLFVDNASTDGSVSYVKKHYKMVKVIQNRKNVGFAKGHDIAIKRAKGDAMLLLNTDTIVERNFLDELVKQLYKNENIGLTQPKILMYPQKDRIDSIGAFFLPSGILYHYGRGKDASSPMYNKRTEIYSAKGVCMLIKKDVILKTGLFDKDYFAYFEETDLCHRIWLSGYKVLYVPTSIVYHKGGGSAKQMAYAYILFHSYKNRLCTYLKNLSFIYLVKTLPLTISLYLCAFMLYLLTGKWLLALAVLKGIFWNISNIKKTLKKRSTIQRQIRTIRDNDFLPKLTKSVKLGYYFAIYFNKVPDYKD